MKLKDVVSTVLMGSVLAACGVSAGNAATVRGRVVHAANKRPAAGYSVTVAKTGRLRARSTAVRVGADGMYNVFNVSPGSYYLEVWVPGQTPRVYPIQVHETYTDLPQVAVP